MDSSISRIRRVGIMMLALAAAVLFLASFQYMAASARSANHAVQAPATASPPLADKVIVANVTGTINIIDTANDIVYGPFLTGSLGSSGGGIFDVAVTPDGRTALISNFGDMAVYFVDVTDPFSPSVIISVTTPMFAEDIAISHDGKFALVTDGGFSPYVATLDLISHTLVYTTELEHGNANAVAIAPDGTVVLADYFYGEVHTLLLDTTGVLSYTGSYSYTVGPDGSVSENMVSAAKMASNPAVVDEKSKESPDGPLWMGSTPRPSPVNVAIAPDGQTVLVCNASPYTSTETFERFDVGVYRITAPGELSFSGAITELNRATQSAAFSPAGDKAFLSGNGGGTTTMEYDQLAVLEITGPGNVHFVRNGAADYPRITGSQLFGVDTIAVANGRAYLGYPTLSGASDDVRIVDLSDYSVKYRRVADVSSGVAVIPIKKYYLPLLMKGTP